MDCVLGNIITSLHHNLSGLNVPAVVTIDREGMRRDLEAYMYRTSHSRMRKFKAIADYNKYH